MGIAGPLLCTVLCSLVPESAIFVLRLGVHNEAAREMEINLFVHHHHRSQELRRMLFYR